MARTNSGIKEALLILEVLRCIPKIKKITAKEIQDSLESWDIHIETRTLQRYLKTITDTKPLDIECDKKSKPYGYKKGTAHNSLSDIALNPAESLLLLLAQEHMKYQMPKKIMDSLDFLFNTAEETLRESHPKVSARKEKAWLKKVAVVPAGLPQKAAQIKERIFGAVSEALYRNLKLDIEYVNNDGEKTKARIFPLGLVEQEARIYLVAQFDGYENYRHLALHRMVNAKVTDIEGTRPKDFDLQRYIAERHFNYGNGKKVKWVVQFTNPATAQNLKETPFSDTQEVKEIRKGVFQLTAVMQDSIWLKGWEEAYRDIAGILKVTTQTL